MPNSETVLTPELLGAGTYYSAPHAWDAATTSSTATAVISTQDMSNTGNKLTISIEASFDGGKSFSPAESNPWMFPTNDKSGNPLPPSANVGYSSSGPFPTHTRCRLDISVSINIGVQIQNA